MNRAILVAMLLLAACSDDNGDGDNGPPAGGADRSAALDAATASAEETEQAVDAIAGTASALSPQGLRAGMRALVIPPRPLCATASSTTDSDGDGTLDNAVYTYALPACAFSDFRGGNLELTGAIQASDEDPLPGYAYRMEYQDFVWNMTTADPGTSYRTTRNGMRRLAHENGTLVLNSALTVQRGFGERGEGFVTSEIRSGVTERYDVRTITPLGIDPVCASFPRISSGEVHYVLTDSSYVRVTWPGCGMAAVQEFVEP